MIRGHLLRIMAPPQGGRGYHSACCSTGSASGAPYVSRGESRDKLACLAVRTIRRVVVRKFRQSRQAGLRPGGACCSSAKSQRRVFLSEGVGAAANRGFTAGITALVGPGDIPRYVEGGGTRVYTRISAPLLFGYFSGCSLSRLATG